MEGKRSEMKCHLSEKQNLQSWYSKHVTVKNVERICTATPLGKQRQKKLGRGLPVAFFIESVITPVINTAYKSPDTVDQIKFNDQLKALVYTLRLN